MIEATHIGSVHGVWEDVQTLIKKTPQYLSRATAIVEKAGPHLDVIESVIEDPALPQVVQRVRTIRTMEQGAVPTLPGMTPAKPTMPTKLGVGLHRAVKPLDMYIYVRRHPWLPYVAGAGVVIVLVGIGFGAGYGVARARAT